MCFILFVTAKKKKKKKFAEKLSVEFEEKGCFFSSAT